MPQTHFVKTNISASSGSGHKSYPRTKLSEAARAGAKVRRQEASAQYQHALREAYGTVERDIKAIANTHAKSVQRVRSDLRMAPQVSMTRHNKKSAWNAFCWKKSQEKENNSKTLSILLYEPY